MPAINDDVFDVTIIGGGPTGLYAAYYAGLRGMRTKLIDSLEQLGGQLTALYPEKYIFDVPGFTRITAKDLADNLAEQMVTYDPVLALGEEVLSVVTGDVITVTTRKGVHRSKSLLVCAGVGAFTPRKLDVPGLSNLEGKGVFYNAFDMREMAGKRIVIVGGGDSAFDWAMHLADTARSIVQIHRTDKFRAHEDSVAKVRSLPVDLRTFHELKEVHGSCCVQGVTIFDNRTKEEMHVACDAVLLNLGFLTNLGPVKQWGLQLLGNYVAVNSRMETNLPGVYAAGDVANYDGKLRLIVTGFGEAAIAVNHAKAYVDPSARVNPGHSSEGQAPVSVQAESAKAKLELVSA